MGSASPTAPFNISIIFIKEEINLGLPVFAGAIEWTSNKAEVEFMDEWNEMRWRRGASGS